MTQELWKGIPGFPDYMVSNLGNVRCFTPKRGRSTHRNFKPHRASNGYLQVVITAGGHRRILSVHRLVADAFLGPRPEGMHTRHLDGDKNNNAVANLAYGTPAENGQDKVRHGRSNTGERNVKAKLTEVMVADIREARAKGVSAKQLASFYLLNPSTVHRIVNGTYWTLEASNRRMDRAAT